MELPNFTNVYSYLIVLSGIFIVFGTYFIAPVFPWDNSKISAAFSIVIGTILLGVITFLWISRESIEIQDIKKNIEVKDKQIEKLDADIEKSHAEADNLKFNNPKLL